MSSSSSTDFILTPTDAILEVYVPVDLLHDFEYCGVGCWITLGLFAWNIIYYILPVIGCVLSNLDLPKACLGVLASLVGSGLEIVYAVLGFAKLVKLHEEILNGYQQTWLALTCIGFFWQGMKELYAFCAGFSMPDEDGDGEPDPIHTINPRQSFELFQKYQELPGDMGGILLCGVYPQSICLLVCFCLLLNVLLVAGQGGSSIFILLLITVTAAVIWMVWPFLYLFIVAVDKEPGGDAPAPAEQRSIYLFARATETIAVVLPLILVEAYATNTIGFVTAALLIRDGMELGWALLSHPWCFPPEHHPANRATSHYTTSRNNHNNNNNLPTIKEEEQEDQPTERIMDEETGGGGARYDTTVIVLPIY